MNAAMKASDAARAKNAKLKSVAAAHRSPHSKTTRVTMDDVLKPLGKPSDYSFCAPESLEEMKAKLGF
jgi:hypothetical protein